MSKAILLADDDKDDAEIFKEALYAVDRSVEFFHVDTGLALFDFLDDEKNVRPSAIFLDLNMPEMNGWQCLAKLKNEKRFEAIPVIIYTTSSNPRENEIAQDLNAHGLITKPTDPKVLKKVLEIVITNLETKQLREAVKKAHLMTRE
ncbi:MAG TPA: response regulator [Chryseolinea sp.]|nr:response regulator [Chryseolinea sp.]